MRFYAKATLAGLESPLPVEDQRRAQYIRLAEHCTLQHLVVVRQCMSLGKMVRLANTKMHYAALTQNRSHINATATADSQDGTDAAHCRAGIQYT